MIKILPHPLTRLGGVEGQILKFCNNSIVNIYRAILDLGCPSPHPSFLALVCDVYCDFVTFPFGILGQVWNLIVSIPDPCCLSYFVDVIAYLSLIFLPKIFLYRTESPL